MSLKSVVGHRFLDKLFKPLQLQKPDEWRALVLDKLSTRMISSCIKMHDLIDSGITIVENLELNREPLPKLEAIYILIPGLDSIKTIVSDFKEQPIKYKAAHIFFTEVCPDSYLAHLQPIKKYIKTVKEINIAFLPYEAQVFSLDRASAFNKFYKPTVENSERIQYMEKMGEQLATLCACLGECPSIRFRHDSPKLTEFAHIVQGKLVEYKAEDPSMGEGSAHKHRSQLIILDRAFDPISPLLHELTFQAMAYDLLPMNNDVYKFISKSGDNEKEVLLDDNDEMWRKLRHLHIADVSRTISQEIKEFATNKRISTGEKSTLKDLQIMLKKMPQYQQELGKYIIQFHLAEDCMKHYKETADKLCGVEQDLATGFGTDHERIRDPMKNIVPLLLDKNVSIHDKIRIILLYILFKNGITEENLTKLCQHAQIPQADRAIIMNLAHLGVPIAQDSGKKKIKPDRKERNDSVYQLSRYVPYVKDIMEDAIEDKLSTSMFPFLNQRTAGGLSTAATGQAVSARFGKWYNKHDKASSDARDVPRLIVFIVGGACYSELRTAYEVTAANPNWEVLIGSDQIITPKLFLEKLGTIST